MSRATGDGPTTAERIRSTCVRGGSALLAVDGVEAVATPLHHLLADGSVAVAVPKDGALAAVAISAGSAGVPALLELTDYAPLPLRKPVRTLVWAWGTVHYVTLPATNALLDVVAAENPDPALLQVDTAASVTSGVATTESETRYTLLRLALNSAVAADAAGTDSVEVGDLLAAHPDPFCAMETAWLQHLESGHPDVLARLTSQLPAELRRGRVRPLSLDRYGIRLRVECADDDHDVRMAFNPPVHDACSLSRAIRVLMGCPFRNGLRARRN
jgi:hypothetical protein